MLRELRVRPQKVRKSMLRFLPLRNIVQQKIAEAIPPNAIVFNEAPTSERLFQAALTLPHSHYQTASGGLGFAMPAAVGAALAQTDRPVMCIVGDGIGAVFHSGVVDSRKTLSSRDIYRDEQWRVRHPEIFRDAPPQ